MEKRSVKTTAEDPTIPTRPGWEGLRVWWLVSGNETGSDNVLVNITHFPPGKQHEVHRHPDHEEVLYILSGSGLHHTGDEIIPVEQGAMTYTAAGEWHGFENNTDTPVQVLGVWGGVSDYAELGYEVPSGAGEP